MLWWGGKHIAEIPCMLFADYQSLEAIWIYDSLLKQSYQMSLVGLQCGRVHFPQMFSRHLNLSWARNGGAVIKQDIEKCFLSAPTACFIIHIRANAMQWFKNGLSWLSALSTIRSKSFSTSGSCLNISGTKVGWEWRNFHERSGAWHHILFDAPPVVSRYTHCWKYSWQSGAFDLIELHNIWLGREYLRSTFYSSFSFFSWQHEELSIGRWCLSNSAQSKSKTVNSTKHVHPWHKHVWHRYVCSV